MEKNKFIKMSTKANYIFRVFGYNIADIIEKIYESLDKLKEDENKNDLKNTSIKVCNHELLGEITYIICDKEIKISFSGNGNDYFILKEKVLLMKEENDKKVLSILTKTDLETVLNKFEKKFDFIVNSQITDKSKILIDLPTKIILRKKLEENGIKFKIFEDINNKQKMPNKEFISIETNILIPQNIYSLEIYRERKIDIVIKKRDELINEVKSFMDDENEKIMKVFGVDGIGKSITCIYLTSLINNFKTIYFNLKEFYNEDSYKNCSKKNDIFKSQLINYYTNENNCKDKKEADKINRNDFETYLKSMQTFDESFMNKSDFNFWKFLEKIIEEYSRSYRYKILVIIDQYKFENDNDQALFYLEQKIINDIDMENVKLLVVLSLNDMGVKDDFIGVLKGCSKKLKKENIKIIEDSDVQDNILNDYEDIFKDFSDKQNYLENGEKDVKNFEKITIFSEIENKKENKPLFNESVILNKVDNFRSNYKNNYDLKIDSEYKIIYINDLISIEPIEENKLIKEKLVDFKFRENKNINDAYNDFIKETYEKIKGKIKKFYNDFNKKFDINLTGGEIALILLQLINLEESKIELDLNSLIYYLNKFPIKYLKIIDIKNDKNDRFLELNEKISDSKFRIEFAFPFIKFVISRIIFDYGESRAIHYTDMSASGIGSILEKIIRKAIIVDKIFGDINSRYVWSLNKFLTPRIEKDTNKQKSDKEYELNIDFFNFKEISYDDEKTNPLINYYQPYYIIPRNNINKILDSMLLVPCMLSNEIQKLYYSISLQITTNKKLKYILSEYHDAAISASNLAENIYNIKIVGKYFIFILLKEYDNQSTIDSLKLGKIPYIFFSSNDNAFLFDDGKKKIDYITQLLIDKFLIQNEDESFYGKERKYLKMETLLKQKRKRDKIKITKNLFSFLRKKLYNNEKPLILDEQTNKKIINTLKNIDIYKNKNIIIEYIFRTTFSKAKELLKNESKLLGVVFYKEKIFIINSKLIPDIKMIDKEKNKNNKIRLDFYDLVHSNCDENKLERITEKPNFEYLMKYSQINPSNLFIFSIYEINE